MTRSFERLARAATVTIAILAAAACSSSNNDTGSTPVASPTSAVAASTTSAQPPSGADACSALPRDTIQQITGADPGEGELEQAAQSTICRYYGDTTMVVEIDPGTDVGQAQVSEEAYGKTCAPIDAIGDAALFCTSPPTGLGATGEIVWTDGLQLYFVEYNFGKTTATMDVPLQLAQALDP